jgi:hypothetical protein
MGAVGVPVFDRRGNRESGVNPELPRSGKQEQKPSSALVVKTGKRRRVGCAVRL